MAAPTTSSLSAFLTILAVFSSRPNLAAIQELSTCRPIDLGDEGGQQSAVEADHGHQPRVLLPGHLEEACVGPPPGCTRRSCGGWGARLQSWQTSIRGSRLLLAQEQQTAEGSASRPVDSHSALMTPSSSASSTSASMPSDAMTSSIYASMASSTTASVTSTTSPSTLLPSRSCRESALEGNLGLISSVGTEPRGS